MSESLTLVANLPDLAESASSSYVIVNVRSKVTLTGGCRNSNADPGNMWCSLANTATQPLDPGTHTIEIRALCTAGEAQVYTGWMNVILFP
jgi:hypothetical protein